jgi:hypothetical protein
MKNFILIKTKIIMTQENKNLLLKDLCARAPYGVKCQCYDGRIIASLTGVKSETELYFHEFDWKEDDGIIEIEFCKPYLFPLSSMTEEQEEEYNDLNGYELGCFPHTEEALDYLIKNHFDYRGLIPMDLAIDATRLNIY